MEKQNRLHFDSRVIHDAAEPDDWQGATLPPIFQSASAKHDTAQSLSDTFSGIKKDHIYMRLTNPTNEAFEKKITSLENGKGAVVMGSGMAAVANTCMALLRSGDEFVAGSSLFMSTYLLFTTVFKKYNLNATLVDPRKPEEIEAAITRKTRFVYIETIGNPGMDVPDIEKIAETAHKHGLPLIVDNTLASPYLVRPLSLGANAVIHSTTKYLSGHGAATGGVVVDGGNFEWGMEKFPDFQPFVERKGELALRERIWREHHINFGSTQAPFHSYLGMIGVDTLALRMERHLSNAVKVADFLDNHEKVKWVNFPGLAGHPDRETADRVFSGRGFGAMITFGLKNREACFSLIDNLNMVYHLANLGDCKTLIIHPWSSQYVSFAPEEKAALSVTSDMLRLSVGIENPSDIMADIDRALESV